MTSPANKSVKCWCIIWLVSIKDLIINKYYVVIIKSMVSMHFVGGSSQQHDDSS